MRRRCGRLASRCRAFASGMNAQYVANTLFAWSSLLENGHAIRCVYDNAALISITARAREILPELTAQGTGMATHALTVINEAEQNMGSEHFADAVVNMNEHASQMPDEAAVLRTPSPPPSPSRVKEEPARQTPTHDEAAELRAIAQLKDEIRELLHARDGPLSTEQLLVEYASRFGKDLVKTGGGRIWHRSVADPLVLSWMKRRGMSHTSSQGLGKGRKKVYRTAPLLASDHFTDVVDVYPRGDGLSFMFVLAGSPAPPPSPVFADVSASWLQALPSGKRAKLEAALSAAATPH
jgi:hypothetical protein